MRGIRVLVLKALVLIATADAASAGDYTADPPSNASIPSPFAGCGVGGPGTNFVNAEVEPWIAVNPADPTNVIGIYQQDRWSNAAAKGLVAAVSRDTVRSVVAGHGATPSPSARQTRGADCLGQITFGGRCARP